MNFVVVCPEDHLTCPSRRTTYYVTFRRRETDVGRCCSLVTLSDQGSRRALRQPVAGYASVRVATPDAASGPLDDLYLMSAGAKRRPADDCKTASLPSGGEAHPLACLMASSGSVRLTSVGAVLRPFEGRPATGRSRGRPVHALLRTATGRRLFGRLMCRYQHCRRMSRASEPTGVRRRRSTCCGSTRSARARSDEPATSDLASLSSHKTSIARL